MYLVLKLTFLLIFGFCVFLGGGRVGGGTEREPMLSMEPDTGLYL